MQLEGTKVIVVGGTKGIGAGVVRGYAREGAQVVFCGTNEERGKATEAEANAQAQGGGYATYIRCNVAEKAQVDAFFSQALAILGGLDVLANIAGVEKSLPAELFTQEDVDFVMGVNFNGTVWTNQAAYKAFKESGVEGAIINYASDTGMTGAPNMGIYAASKGAVLAWTRTIAMEWGSAGNVRCNCVSPAIKTPMYEGYLASMPDEARAAFLAETAARFPIDGDMGEIDRDLVPVMVFLATPGSRYINGQCIAVNGGLVMVR